ncbi:hypothetical protein FJ364_00830, partial [Candidatus Dependentiae bacterium]|nr:hypothetical protein [Candidatus Dependentiae bacterium]
MLKASRIFFFIIFLCNSIYGMNSTEVAFHSSPNMPNRYFKLAAQSNNLLERSDLPSLKRHKYEEEFITALADISCEGIYAQNKQNQTPVHIALERNNTTIAQRFITVLQSQAEKVWLCSLRDHSGQTLLHITFKKLRQLLEEHRTLCLNNKQLGIENNSLTDHTLCLQAENMSLSQKNSAAKRINDNEVIIQKNCARLAQIEAEEAVNSEQLDRITYLKNELIKFACMILPYSNYLRSDLSASRQTAVSIYNTSL